MSDGTGQSGMYFEFTRVFEERTVISKSYIFESAGVSPA